jgi:hypothetical protein
MGFSSFTYELKTSHVVNCLLKNRAWLLRGKLRQWWKLVKIIGGKVVLLVELQCYVEGC